MVTAIDEKRLPFPWVEIAEQFTRTNRRPWVTLSYAQSLDGCITSYPGQSTPISSSASMELTHQLRAAHNAILVGIGTVLVDDPLLNVRLIAGPNPQPIILDSSLRTPLTSQLVKRLDKKPWIAYRPEEGNSGRQERLLNAGVRLIPTPLIQPGNLDLVCLLETLAVEGISSLMVEGGAEVIASFLSNRLVDWAVITVAPIWLGGLRPKLSTAEAEIVRCGIEEPRFQQMGKDMIVSGRVV